MSLSFSEDCLNFLLQHTHSVSPHSLLSFSTSFKIESYLFLHSFPLLLSFFPPFPFLVIILSLSFFLSFTSFFLFPCLFIISLLPVKRNEPLNFPDTEIMYIPRLFKKVWRQIGEVLQTGNVPGRVAALPAFSSRPWPTKPLVLHQKNKECCSWQLSFVESLGPHIITTET